MGSYIPQVFSLDPERLHLLESVMCRKRVLDEREATSAEWDPQSAACYSLEELGTIHTTQEKFPS